MLRPESSKLRDRLPADIIEAAALGARLEARRRCHLGQDSPTVRRELLDRLQADLRDEGYADPAIDGLLAICSRSIDSVLAEYDGRRREALLAAN